MPGGQRRFVRFRYNLLSSIPFTTILFTAVVGVTSGFYIFDGPAREAAAAIQKKQEEKE